MDLGFERCAQTGAGDIASSIVITFSAGIKGDFSGLIGHRHDVFMVHHDTGRGVVAEVNLRNTGDYLFIFAMDQNTQWEESAAAKIT